VDETYNLKCLPNTQAEIVKIKRYLLRENGSFSMINTEPPFKEKAEYKQEMFLRDKTDPILNCIPARLFNEILKDDFWMNNVFLKRMDDCLEQFVKQMRKMSALNVSEGDRFLLAKQRVSAFERISSCPSLKMEDVLKIDVSEVRMMLKEKIRQENLK
jgi:hypothetical protein